MNPLTLIKVRPPRRQRFRLVSIQLHNAFPKRDDIDGRNRTLDRDRTSDIVPDMKFRETSFSISNVKSSLFSPCTKR